MTVASMLSIVSSQELSEWRAYFKVKENMTPKSGQGKANKTATLG